MKSVSFRANSRQTTAIEKATERGFAENESEAARMLIDHAAEDLGIINGEGLENSAERQRLKSVMHEASVIGANIGVAWGLVLTLYPASAVNWGLVGPLVLVLLVIVSKDMLFKYA